MPGTPKISFLWNGYGVGVVILVEILGDNLVCALYNPLLEILDSREEGECWITLKSLV
ncbi:MAG: hypothetical protein JNK77_15185 [Saprospiraceae bacterium]|nr:hypothetical protein [Saprospiraceae bacterium]